MVGEWGREKGGKVTWSGMLLTMLCALEHSAGARTFVWSREKQAALLLVLTLPRRLTAGKGQPGCVIFMMAPAHGRLGAGPLGTVPLARRVWQPRWRGPAKALLLRTQKYLENIDYNPVLIFWALAVSISSKHRIFYRGLSAEKWFTSIIKNIIL